MIIFFHAPTGSCWVVGPLCSTDRRIPAMGAPTISGTRVQSGNVMLIFFPSGVTVAGGAISSGSGARDCASSHRSRWISSPPVLSALKEKTARLMLVVAGKYGCTAGRGEIENTHPARDPPTQGKSAGVNAGAFPALAAAEEVDGGGAGSLTIAMCDTSDLRGPYGSYRLGLPFAGRFRVLANSCRSRGINPGSIAVPPTIRMEEISVFRRSSGA